MVERLAILIATGLGLGYVPVAPGTAGSAMALPIAWLLFQRGGFLGLSIGAVVTIPVAVWASGRAEKHYGVHDSCHIVVDEVAGQLITFLLVPCTWPNLIVGFGWFRLFDSVKPWPANWADREVKGGVGVVLDDIMAGIYAAGVTAACVHSGLVAGSVGWMRQLLFH